MCAFFPGISMPSTSSASLNWDWDDEDQHAFQPGSSSEPSSSQGPSLASTPWLRDFEELAGMNDSFFPVADFSPALVPRDPHLSFDVWKDSEVMGQNTQKLFVSFSHHARRPT